MTENRVGQQWTDEEDELLRQAVSIHGPNDNWKMVAQGVPGRTNKACRKRWLHSLSPDVKKTAWTPDEDSLLKANYDRHGPKWSLIAKHIPGRTDDACSKRYREALDPSLRRDEWTREEDSLLLDMHARIGSKWSQLAQHFGRASLDCRNRWRCLERERQKAEGRQQPRLDFVHLPQVPPVPHLPERPQPLPPLDQSWATIPFLTTPAFWDSSPSSYSSPSVIMQDGMAGDMSTHESLYMSPEYSPQYSPQYSPGHSHDYHDSHMHINGLQGASPHPSGPHYFNPQSSSLHSALSISLASPSSSHLSTPAPGQPRELCTSVPSVGVEHGLPSPQHQNPERDLISDPVTQVRGYVTASDVDAPSLGCTNISVPVPFPDLSQADPPSIRTDMGSYPTPVPSPTTEESSPTPVAETFGTQEKDPLRHYRTPAEKRKATVVKPLRKKVKEDGPPPRLSSNLPVNSNVRAYVCGFESCWPGAASMSKSCFATSQELCDHSKVDHGDDADCERPFRCGLAGCGKGWRSVNGLQYHLQISKAHFQQAVSAKLCTEVQIDDCPAEAAEAAKRKLFSCTKEGCPNQYKQLSGLRYHLKHGHSTELPTQLDSIPPALAKKVEQKIHGKVII